MKSMFLRAGGLEQMDLPRMKVLVVDDGSTDDSFETATELSIEYPQVRVLRRTGQGGLAEALRQIRAALIRT